MSTSMARSPKQAATIHITTKPNGSSTTMGPTMEIGGHRAKRIKISNSVDQNTTVLSLSDKDMQSRRGNGVDGTDVATREGREISSGAVNTVIRVQQVAAPLTQDPDALLSNDAARTVTTSNSGDTSKTMDLSTNTHFQEDALRSSNLDVDLSSAPADPSELSLWIAQQLSHFQVGGRHDSKVRLSRSNSMHLNEEDEEQSTSSLSPGHSSSRPDESHEAVKAAEREKIRRDNRQRKQQWRQIHNERNKDNDLRCRINKRAKTLFGPGTSSVRLAWIESEFNKRRAKRESKERLHAVDEGHFPGAVVSPDLGRALFQSNETDLQSEVNAAGILLSDALLTIGSSGRPKLETAVALKSALEGGKMDQRSFIEAFRKLAAHPEIMNGINALLKYDGDNDEIDTSSATETPGHASQPAERQNGSGDGQNVTDDRQSTIKLEALRAATAMLGGMSEIRTNSITTCYESPLPQHGDTKDISPKNGDKPQRANGTNKETKARPIENDYRLDESQIDALLALANGGSLAADENDDITADETSQDPDQMLVPQPDSDVTAFLRRIVHQLTTDSNGDANFLRANDARRAQDIVLGAESYNLASVKDQATALQSLFDRAGISINTIIPAAQSRATSQLYQRLSNRARSTVPMGGGINPDHANSYGNTAQMNQRMLAKPGVFGKPLDELAIESETNAKGTFWQGLNPEERKKIKSYGFPPLPGSRPGMRKI